MRDSVADMELRHLTAFVAVAEEGGFTAAAARLVVVQSAVSASVKALERELGTPLLERTSRRVALTDAGATLLPHARATLDAARDAREAVTAVRQGLGGTVRVGTMTSVGLVDVPALLGAFHREHPGVTIRLSAAPSGSHGLVAAVAERGLDLAFVSVPGGAAPGVRLTEIASAAMDLVVPPEHPLASASTVGVADLDGLDFIDSPVGYGNRSVTDRAFAAAGAHRRVTLEVADIGTAAAYVRHGLGVAVLPRFVAEPAGAAAQAVVVPLAGDLRWPMQLALPADRRPAAATLALAQHIRRSAGAVQTPSSRRT